MERVQVHIPPRYNQYGNRQFWFVEIDDCKVDEVINGALFAVTLAVVFYATAFLYQGATI